MDNATLAEKMKPILATTFSLAIKAQNYHWNVTGANFGEYHNFFGSYYGELYGFVDIYAEHIRQLGMFTPGSLSRFSEMSKVGDEINVPAAQVMMSRLSKDNAKMTEMLKSIHPLAVQAKDIGLVATLDTTIQFHSKMQWMIDSYIS